MSLSALLDSKHYDPAAVEQKIYTKWIEAGVFTAHPESQRPPYSLVIPPPNVTGRLHMGHALNNTIQDLLSRYKRMDGFDVLWVPGTDHAGISTQSIVKKHLDAEGIDWRELGREGVVARIWEWKERYGGKILEQLRRLGCSCDWTRTAFTMDENLSRAVKVAFVKLYEAGLIYRGKYIVNWCPVDRTALSDDEVLVAEGGEPGFLWHIRYPLSDGSGSLVVATTRPETMLGDTAIAVHPSDERYQALIGKSVRLPLVNRDIPIIADEFVESAFGTGCVKITPAHDPNDFQVAVRHNLPMINVMNEDATMNEAVPERFQGLDRFACRTAVEGELSELGLLEGKEERMTPIGRSYRSRAVIEYRLSDQWFVKMRPLAETALQASEQGKVRFFPDRWDSFYQDWLKRTRDWCISRQLWWGHRIPAWYNIESGEMIVATETPAAVSSDPTKWRQDEDVLDTWFSSALWPYSTLGWPDATNELRKYYPTSVLVTGKDIIFFWVARMVMTGLFLAGDVPFSEVVINSIILDEKGDTMSKSKGNGIDPLHVIEGATAKELEEPILEARPSDMAERLQKVLALFPNGFQGVGADALRYTLLTGSTDAQQMQISLLRFAEIGRPFTDKIWNASRLIATLLQESGVKPSTDSTTTAPTAIEDQWILGRLTQTIEQVRSAFDSYALHRSCDALYHFFWSDLCDWYLELIKPRMRGTDLVDKQSVVVTLAQVMGGFLRLMHPIMPFLTEEVWGIFRPEFERAVGVDSIKAVGWRAELCAAAEFPTVDRPFDATLDAAFELHRSIVRTIRAMRATAGLSGKVPLEVEVKPLAARSGSQIEALRALIVRGANCAHLTVVDTPSPDMTANVLDEVEIYVNLRAHIDVGAEIDRNQRQLTKVQEEVTRLEAKLSNEGFVAKAPATLVESEKARLADAQARAEKIQLVLSTLSGK